MTEWTVQEGPAYFFMALIGKKLEETHSREFLQSAEFRRSGGACLWAVNPPAIWDVISEQKPCLAGLRWWSSCPRTALFLQQRAVEVLTLV